jgi:hypothetical protein
LQIEPLSPFLASSNLTTLLLEVVELSQVTPFQEQQPELEISHPSIPDSMQLEKLIKALRSVELHVTFWHLMTGALKLIVHKMKVK